MALLHSKFPRRASAQSSSASIYDGFKTPPPSARPFFRWWWNGNRITQDEVIRELKIMRQAGAGGVEINPIEWPEHSVDTGAEPVEWLSEAWIEILQSLLSEAESLDMRSDLIVGSGWPFGGKFLPEDETIQGLEVEWIEKTGPTIITLDPASTPNRKLLMLQWMPDPLNDLSQIKDAPLQENNLINIDLPKGNYRIMLIWVKRRFRDVMHGAPGADGPVLDHFNEEAVNHYLYHMSDMLNEHLDGTLGQRIRSMFCDSIELEGADWTHDLLQIFKERRGYDLSNYLALIQADAEWLDENLVETQRAVRYDYSKTLAELFQERFIVPFHRWCQDIGVKSRYQSYGYPWLYTDLLEGYLVPDIPEGDQWLFNRGWMHDVAIDDIRYAVWNKYASSAAHQRGKQIASSEAMTNTRGVFEASLEYIKQATDLNAITGINHLVLHGFNYSPPEAGFPGWIRFGTYFNEQNPWWPYVHLWMDYAARLSWAFQQTTPVHQAALLGATPDVWSRWGLDRSPWITHPNYWHELWQAFTNNGCGSDYVNSTTLSESRVENNQLMIGPMRYDILVVAESTYIEPETIEIVERIASQGVPVTFINRLPDDAPGLSNHAERQSQVRDIVAQLKENPLCQIKPLSNSDELMAWANACMSARNIKPTIQLSDREFRLMTAHRRNDGLDMYFLANLHRDKTIQTKMKVTPNAPYGWLWDMETGDRSPIGYDSDQEIPLALKPLESKLIVFDYNTPSGKAASLETNELQSIQTVKGPWQVRIEPIEGDAFETELDELIDLSQHEDFKTFSGTITYRTTLQSVPNEATALDAGNVHETAEAWLDVEHLGVQWWGKRRFDLPTNYKKGSQELKIRVTTLAYNYCRSMQDQPLIAKWLERSQTKEYLPSGLLGPVRFLGK